MLVFALLAACSGDDDSNAGAAGSGTGGSSQGGSSGASNGGSAGTGAGGAFGSSVKVLTANIGNADDAEPNYPLRMSYQSYEEHVGAKIRELAPDVVFLQEVLPPQTCEAFTESDPARTCYDAANRPTPAQRILGEDYSIVCDNRLHVECIGIRTSFGTIDGVDAGGFVLTGAETPALPMAECSYFAGECDDTKCDREATVSAITITSKGTKIRVAHAHPNAAGSGANGVYSGEPCRYEQLVQYFEGDGALVGDSSPVIGAGDFNMDPEIFSSDREKELWQKYVGKSKRFAELGPPRDEFGKYYPTRVFAIDHVIGDGLSGSCKVLSKTYKEDDPNMMPPLDDGYDFSQVPDGESFAGRIDHNSIFCELTIDQP